MKKSNCWEAKKCGRQPGGEKCGELGICPAAIKLEAHNLNNGINGGRSCWAISGTLCGGEVQGSFASKIGSCMRCDFYLQVRREEKNNFLTTKDIVNKL